MSWLLSLISTNAFAASSGHLPLQGTGVTAQWDGLYLFLVCLSVFFFVIVVGGMMVFVYKYKQRPGLKAKYITGNVPREVLWTAVPFMMLMGIFAWGYHVYTKMTRVPQGAYEIRVVGKQWLWQFQYDDGRQTVNELYVPVNKPVKLLMTSSDILHSFFVPNFRVKSDVLPGLYTTVWFEANVPGTHDVFCTEYCGTSHSLMQAKVIALEPAHWEAWRAGKKIDDIPDAGETRHSGISAKDKSSALKLTSSGAHGEGAVVTNLGASPRAVIRGGSR